MTSSDFLYSMNSNLEEVRQERKTLRSKIQQQLREISEQELIAALDPEKFSYKRSAPFH